MAILLAPLLLTLAGTAAPQAAAAPAAAVPPAAYGSRYRGRIFVSPMGEPFRPASHEDDTLADWFRQADGNHDGQLTVEEMQQDSGRFFALLDVNHDGEIDPDEITRYEDVVAPEIKVGAGYELAAAGRNDNHQGGARFSLLDLPEPVVSADANFNRGVSLAEFRQAAAQRFLALDIDHKGLLTFAELSGIRPAAPPAPNKPSAPKEVDESALPSPGY
ncbi:MAG: hypothetical protein ACJ8FO_01770 [Sphingomicrobium sp.]